MSRMQGRQAHAALPIEAAADGNDASHSAPSAIDAMVPAAGPCVRVSSGMGRVGTSCGLLVINTHLSMKIINFILSMQLL